ncbi:SEC-C metal-binding domain-containing protein [Achromobacter sp. ACM05]|uniref:SEC-C metal-binding domain-containing protein n=1 Tax=Achromobacter sp. ACM05 TaxID=2854776 RepID=UPI001C47B8E3|nr:SEC-C metal-binding domain-containing protein [Achromobacter sp. ACM05]MBV7502722.1 SEC-C domain-containing protein [Achromobacter sp. ACM05]
MLNQIHKTEGTTPGERELTRLANLSFFGLWSYASVHRLKGNGSIKHEVADLLVVFGNDVIIFSEKDITFPDSNNIVEDWGRWFRKSISKSVSQLRGAEKYIKSKDNALFLDEKCTKPFPFQLNASELRVHLIAFCRNSCERAKGYFAQNQEEGASTSTGTLVFLSPLREQEMLLNPFHIGDFDPKKPFIHVFDEDSLSLLLTELDTGPDFIDYLCAREQSIRGKTVSFFYGEEDFLAVYLKNIQANGFGCFRADKSLPTAPENALPTIEEGMWQLFKLLPYYAIHEQQRKHAGFWKSVIDDFSQSILTATVGEAREESLETHERALRAMASENRISRAALGHALLEKFHTVPTNARSARVVQSSSNPNRLYIFLLFPWIDEHKTYDGYRAERTACMKLYARAAQLKYPAYSEIVILGADTKNSSKGSSETVLVVKGNPEMPEREKAETLAMMEEHRVLTDISELKHVSRSTYAPTTGNVFGNWRPIPSNPPGVNQPCYCGSGKKYKKCCRP